MIFWTLIVASYKIYFINCFRFIQMNHHNVVNCCTSALNCPWNLNVICNSWVEQVQLGRYSFPTFPHTRLYYKLVRKACLHCHGTKRPLLTAFFSLSFFLSLSPTLTFLQEGVIVGFQNFEWGLKSQKIRFGLKNIGEPTLPPGARFFRFFSEITKSA